MRNAPLAVASATALAMALVPCWNLSISKTPIGPFHKMVFERWMTLVNCSAGILADIQAHPAIGDIIAGRGGIVGIGIEFIGDNAIGGQMDANAFLFRLFQECHCGIQAIVFAKGIANLSAGCFQKGIGHAAADDDVGSPFEQVLDNQDLVGDFGAADDGGEWFL